MKICFWSFYEENVKDMYMFHYPDAPAANGIFIKWNVFYRECLNRNIVLQTLDQVDDLNSVDIFIFADFPRIESSRVRAIMSIKKPKILIVEESPLIHPSNWKLKNHALFDVVLTWNDSLIDNIKYFKVNPYCFQDFRSINNPKSKLCVMVARNKRAWGNELYSERRKVINFFQKYHSADLDLFGEGWDRFYFPSNVYPLRLFNGSRLEPLRALLRESYPSWRGRVDNKSEIVSLYKFSFTFENSIGPSGYITEKIWDSFLSGTVPIYYGAPDITDHIPKNCFIDYRDFNNLEELYRFISTMSDVVYEQYLAEIRNFLAIQSRGGQFSVNYFVSTFMDLITKLYRAC